MGTPKKHKTHAGTRQRRSHHALKKAIVSFCPKCSAPLLPHRVCTKCGTYGEKQIKLKEKKTKKTKKEKLATK